MIETIDRQEVLTLIGVIIGMLRGTYSQMETNNRLVGLPLFQMEEGILLSTFLRDGVLSFQVNVLLDEHPLRMGLGGINL